MSDTIMPLPYMRSSELENEKCIRALVCFFLSKRINKPISQLNADTPVPPEYVRAILDDVGADIDRVIPMPSKPRHGFKVSTLVGYIFSSQGSFPRREPPAQ